MVLEAGSELLYGTGQAVHTAHRRELHLRHGVRQPVHYVFHQVLRLDYLHHEIVNVEAGVAPEMNTKYYRFKTQVYCHLKGKRGASRTPYLKNFHLKKTPWKQCIFVVSSLETDEWSLVCFLIPNGMKTLLTTLAHEGAQRSNFILNKKAFQQDAYRLSRNKGERRPNSHEVDCEQNDWQMPGKTLPSFAVGKYICFNIKYWTNPPPRTHTHKS